MTRNLRLVRHMFGLAWRADRKIVIVIVVMMAIQSGALAMIGLSQRWLVDAAAQNVVSGLILATIGGAIAHTLFAAGNRAKNNYQIDLADRVDVELNREILAITAEIPSLEHLEHSEYLDRLSLLRRHTRTLAASCWAFAETIASLISVALSVWLLMDVHPALAALALLALPPLWAAKKAQRQVAEAIKTTAEDQRLEQRLHEMCVEPGTGKEIFLTGAGEAIGETADTARRRAVSTVFRASLDAMGWQLGGWVCYAAGFIGALVLVAGLVSTGQSTLGQLMLLITIGTRLRTQVHVTVENFGELADAGHATDHYLWLQDYRDEKRPTGSRPAPPAMSVIELHEVTFRYPGTETDVLAGVNLRLRTGSTVAIVGVNGAGKTTLVKLLTGMYPPTTGAITVDGVPLQDIAIEQWRSRLSGAFQDFVRFQLPVRQDVGVGELAKMTDTGEVSRAISEASADVVVQRLPDGLDTQLGRAYGGTELSFGQHQRLALARGLMRTEPLVLVLDEPTAALDARAEHELYERFIDKATDGADKVTLLVSHRFSTVRNADHIVVLADGHIAEQGTHDQLMEANGRYAQLYNTQAAAYQ